MLIVKELQFVFANLLLAGLFSLHDFASVRTPRTQS